LFGFVGVGICGEGEAGHVSASALVAAAIKYRRVVAKTNSWISTIPAILASKYYIEANNASVFAV
jgi:hypothetical protein